MAFEYNCAKSEKKNAVGLFKIQQILLFRLQVSVHDAQAVEVVEAQRQLCKVKLDILLCEHHLRDKHTDGNTLQEG